MTDFELDILDQAFMGPGDFSAHGRVRAAIDGVVITSDEPEYGITQSALALLRTIEEDRNAARDERTPFDQGFLLCHDCGFPIGFGCGNFGTNWHVEHDGQEVVLSNARFVDSGAKNFEVAARIPLREYATQIVRFARKARSFYFAEGVHGSELPEVDSTFWAEFDERLERAERLLAEA